MKNKIESIETEFGKILGRDSIYIDRFTHTLYPSKITCKGEINLSNLEYYEGNYKFISYVLTFKNVSYFKAWDIDCNLLAFHTKSSFDEFIGSPIAQREKQKHYILSTYDFIYEIIASDHNLIFGEKRKSK